VKKSINDVIHSLIARVSFSLTGNHSCWVQWRC